MNFVITFLLISLSIVFGEIYFNENPSIPEYYNRISRENIINPDSNIYFKIPSNIVSSPVALNGIPTFYPNGRGLKIEAYRGLGDSVGC
uniref:Uncharacterized protein n=1 Tax=Strongyloides papillosus TaxID=174720 RepID=A0A0N5B5B8_STREA